ncbi:hypothetical protein ACWEJ6_48380 [Nonomuraea sp. NPDC004702]
MNVWYRVFLQRRHRWSVEVSDEENGARILRLRLGIDIACRAAHQASLADERGEFAWSGRRFRTTAEDLERLWAMLPAGTDPSTVTVIMEPTRNAGCGEGAHRPPR